METRVKRIRALFDTARFYEDVDRIRQERGMKWTQIAAATGLAYIRQKPARYGNPRIDTLTLIAIWAGLSLDTYIQAFDETGQPLSLVEYKTRFQPGHQQPGYDVARFYADLNQIREARGLTWHGVWRAVPSTAVPHPLSTLVTRQIALSPRVCEVLASWAGLDFSRYTL